MAEPGDLVGLHTDGAVQVPSDKGTSQTGHHQPGRIKANQSLTLSDLADRELHTKLFGVDGFLD